MRYKCKLKKIIKLRKHNKINTRSFVLKVVATTKGDFANKFNINLGVLKINNDYFSGKAMCEHRLFILFSFSSYVCNFFV